MIFVSPKWAREHVTRLRELFVSQDPSIRSEQGDYYGYLLDQIERNSGLP